MCVCRWRSVYLASWFVSAMAALVSSVAAPVRAQQTATETAAATDSQWLVGTFYRHTWIPKGFVKAFFERGASISNNGLGLAVTHYAKTGVNAELGLGWTPYHFEGAFNAHGAPLQDTEYVTSTLSLLHVTGSLLWPIELHRMLRLEVGLGVDLGIILGSLRRTEAYSDAGGVFRSCDSALHPATLSPATDARGTGIPYCEQAFDDNGKPVASHPSQTSGAQYGAKETRVPPLMLIPMLPHLALRFAPLDRVAIKLEAAFGLAQFWVGASVHVALGAGSTQAEPPTPSPIVASTPIPPSPPPAREPHVVRVIGKLMEQATNQPIAHAAVKDKMQFSAIQTDATGMFVFERVRANTLQLQISHPDYENDTCQVTIPDQAQDTFVHCFLRPLPREGSISGQVKDELGRPVANASVTFTGPADAQKQSDADGLFALVPAPEGIYRLRVEAQGYLKQVIELDVRSHETAVPQIILLPTAEKH